MIMTQAYCAKCRRSFTSHSRDGDGSFLCDPCHQRQQHVSEVISHWQQLDDSSRREALAKMRAEDRKVGLWALQMTFVALGGLALAAAVLTAYVGGMASLIKLVWQVTF